MARDETLSPVDCEARRQALAVDGSFIVQAPAGSGKTELLIQRILALLTVVAAPEEILAITFTRKAAAEMRKRLLDALERAGDDTPPAEAHAVETWQRARLVLARDRERCWGLLDHPARLQLLTIDSLCAALVRRMPCLSGFGEMAAIAEDAGELYRDAAEHLCAHLESDSPESAALQRLLAHLDNRLPLLRDLLMTMLGRRDQWMRCLPVTCTQGARSVFENALRGYVEQSLLDAVKALGPERSAEVLHIGRWAAGNLVGETNSPFAALLDYTGSLGSRANDLPAWLAVADLLLTQQDRLRSPRGINATIGFPPGKNGLEAEMKRRISALLEDLCGDSVCVERLRALRKLPHGSYSDPQWTVLAALIELLPRAGAELGTTFRQRGQVDFAEISRGALNALGDDLAPSDLLLQIDGRLRHILVDEFQDTSRAQYDLLAMLTSGWERDDGRTLFLVGDPMQSIYRFREAEVGLYLRARSHGIGCIRLTPLVLRANFRSQAGLVDWCNRQFQRLFPAAEDAVRGAVPFAPSVATRPTETSPAVTTFYFAPRNDRVEASRVVDLVRQARAEHPDGTTAVLVRARTHLTEIIPALKAAGLRFQAQEIDALNDRPAIQDLLALTRALLHPADRVAWLAVLRAPWCGLSLDDLLLLVNDRPEASVLECLGTIHTPDNLFAGLSVDGLHRLDRVAPILTGAVNQKGRLPLRRLVESTWLSLGGAAGLTTSDLADIEQFLGLLEELDEGGDLVRLETLPERLAGLFAAPDAKAGPELQLMTIHKAKGLEFDTVIIPGLGRTTGRTEPSLLLWQEDPDHGMLLAPIPPAGSDQPEAIYQALAGIHRDKDDLETIRLFYVGVTRAKHSLHLLGHLSLGKDGVPSAPASGSLLHAAWSAIGEEMALVESLPNGESVALPDPVTLRRLPANWELPSQAVALPTALVGNRRASGRSQADQHRFTLSLRSEEGRIIGTLVHLWLERIASDGLASWERERVASLTSQLRGMLAGEGVSGERQNVCIERIKTALQTVLSSRRGRWILAGCQENACELALTGVIDDTAVHAMIDRTFVDEEGIRWIIDYKTSEPEDEESKEAFLERERERYQAQLEDYRRLMQLRDPQAHVRTALYFPLVDLWCEVG